MSQDENAQQDLKPVQPRKPGDPVPEPRRDAQGRPMVEEIDLNEAEEAALDAAWAHLSEKWARERREKQEKKGE